MISHAILALLLLFQQPSFEVASIKRHLEPGPQSIGCRGIDSRPNTPSFARTPLGRCVFTNQLGYHLVTYAYGLEDGPLGRNAMIKGVPEWFQREIYDLNAKALDPAATTEAELIQMLRNLLAERFKLKVHYETREAEGYALVKAESGVKIQPAKAEAPRTLRLLPGKGGEKGPTPTFRQYKAQKYTLADFAVVLSGGVGRAVVDQTGLDGPYDIELQWDTELGPAVFTAVQEQLGLRL